MSPAGNDIKLIKPEAANIVKMFLMMNENIAQICRAVKEK